MKFNEIRQLSSLHIYTNHAWNGTVLLQQ